MKVTARFFGDFRTLTGTSLGSVEVETGSISAVLAALAAQFGTALIDKTLASDGSIKESALLVLNGVVIDGRVPSRYALQDGDTLTFVPPVVGGECD